MGDGKMLLGYMYYRENGMHVAKCVEFDVIAKAVTMKEAKRRLKNMLLVKINEWEIDGSLSERLGKWGIVYKSTDSTNQFWSSDSEKKGWLSRLFGRFSRERSTE